MVDDIPIAQGLLRAMVSVSENGHIVKNIEAIGQFVGESKNDQKCTLLETKGSTFCLSPKASKQTAQIEASRSAGSGASVRRFFRKGSYWHQMASPVEKNRKRCQQTKNIQIIH